MNDLMRLDGTVLTIRPIEPGDVEQLASMFQNLSRESIYFRFFSPLPSVPDATLRRMIDVDHCRRDALVALDGDEIVAIASYDAMPEPFSGNAEIAAVVADAWQHRGIALRLICQLASAALGRGYHTFFARTLPTNRAALALLRRLSLRADAKFIGGEYEMRLTIADLACERSLLSVAGSR